MARKILICLSLASLFFLSCKCSHQKENIQIDGSSTVYVLSEAVAEEYLNLKKAGISIGVSGTGGGFKKLCSGRINIIGASRAISNDEITLCQKNNINYLELAVAYDGIVVAVNKANTFLSEISTRTLKKIFEPQAQGKIMKWHDLDDLWPKKEIQIFAPGVSSGTYDYFTKVIVGKEHESRGDITTSEDDNVLVHGIRSNVDSIGFFSFAYYLENKNELKALAIIDDSKDFLNKKAVLPTTASIHNGTYSPLSRPVFLYVNKQALDQKTKEFLQFYLDNSAKVAEEVGFIALSDEAHQQSLATLQATNPF